MHAHDIGVKCLHFLCRWCRDASDRRERSGSRNVTCLGWTPEERKVPDVPDGKIRNAFRIRGTEGHHLRPMIFTHAHASRQTHAALQDACMREFNVSSVVAMRRGGIWWEQGSGTVKAGILRCCIWIQTSDRALSGCALRSVHQCSLKPRHDQRGSGAASGPHHDDGLQEIHHRQDVQSAQEEGDAAGAGVFGLQCSVRGVGHVDHPDQDRWVRAEPGSGCQSNPVVWAK